MGKKRILVEFLVEFSDEIKRLSNDKLAELVKKQFEFSIDYDADITFLSQPIISVENYILD